MNKKNKGFTLAEMLIVVAIIGVLISIVASIVGNKIEVAREMTDLSNIRNAISKITAKAIDGNYTKVGYNVDKALKDPIYCDTGLSDGAAIQMLVKVSQKKTDWQSNNSSKQEAAGVSVPQPGSNKYYRVYYHPKTDKWAIYVGN